MHIGERFINQQGFVEWEFPNNNASQIVLGLGSLDVDLVDLDIPARKLGLGWERVGEPYTAFGRKFERAPLTAYGTHGIAVQIFIGKKAVTGLLDTGVQSTMISRELASEEGIHATLNNDMVVVPTLTLLGKTWFSPNIAVRDQNIPVIVGMDALQTARLIIDIRKNKIVYSL